MLERIFAAPIVHFLYWFFSLFCFLTNLFSGVCTGWRKSEFPVGSNGDASDDFEMTEELRNPNYLQS